MILPRTKPLDGEFWYILDDQNNVDWKPQSQQRGDFYLSWLGQNRNVVGAGLARIRQGQLTHVCTHGTPYYWLQPYQTLPLTSKVLKNLQMLGADTMELDFSLGGWELRDPTPSPKRQWPDAPLPAATLNPLLGQAVEVIVHNFRSDGEPPLALASGGLLARSAPPPISVDPLDALLNTLGEVLGIPNVVPVLIELVGHDVNVVPTFRRSSFFENLPAKESMPPPSKVARLVLSAIYHLGPGLNSQRLFFALLLNSLRQRHPFDVTWGADFLVKCVGMANLVRLLQAAALKEEDEQIRSNVLDLLQELGYGFSVDQGGGTLASLTDLLSKVSLSGFSQVVNSHLSFIQEYVQQKNAAANQAG
jgi:hypothetical protein